jgi:spore maturation protein SpmB
VRQIGYLQRLYRDARSTEHKILESEALVTVLYRQMCACVCVCLCVRVCNNYISDSDCKLVLLPVEQHMNQNINSCHKTV